MGGSHWTGTGTKSHSGENAERLFAAIHQLGFPCWIQTEVLLPVEPRTNEKGPTWSSPHRIFWLCDTHIHLTAKAPRQARILELLGLAQLQGVFVNPLTASQCRENSQRGLGETKNPKHKQSWEGGVRVVLAFHAQVRQGREEECFPLAPPGPEPLGRLPSPLRAQSLLWHLTRIPLRTQQLWGEESRGSPLCSLLHPGSPGNFPAQPGAVPRNLARAQPMLPSHSTQISLYLPAKWARGASSDTDESREREAWSGQRLQWLFVTGLRKAGEAERVCFTKTKILPGAITRGSEGKKIPSCLWPL